MREDSYALPHCSDVVAQQKLLTPLDLVEVVVLHHEVMLVQEDDERA